jgi:hypothetical protein
MMSLAVGVWIIRVVERKNINETHRRIFSTLALYMVFSSWVPPANTAWLALERVSQLKDIAAQNGFYAQAMPITEAEQSGQIDWEIKTPAGNTIFIKGNSDAGLHGGTTSGGYYSSSDHSSHAGRGRSDRSTDF